MSQSNFNSGTASGGAVTYATPTRFEIENFEKPANPRNFLLITGIIIAIISFLVYAPNRSGNFLADDWVVLNQLTFKYPGFIDNLVWFTRDWGVGVDFYRPLVRLGYYFQFVLFGSNPAGWHLTSALLHMLNSLLVFGIAWRLSKRGSVALLGGLVFALQPIHSEPVSWISGQTDLWATLWVLASVFCFIGMRQAERAGRSGRNQWIAAIVFFVLALLSKEVAVALPVALLVYDFISGGLDRLFFDHSLPHDNKTLRRLAITHAPFWGALVLYFFLRLVLFSGLGGYAPEPGQSLDIALFLRTNLKWLTLPFSLGGPDGLILIGAVGALLALTAVQEWERFRLRLDLPLDTTATPRPITPAAPDDELDDPANSGQGGVASPSSLVASQEQSSILPVPNQENSVLSPQSSDLNQSSIVNHQSSILRVPFYSLRAAAYGFLWVAIFLLPTILTAPAERFTYLPSAGFAIFLGTILAPFGSDYGLLKGRNAHLTWRERVNGFFDPSTFLRVIAILAVLFTYSATTNARVSDWLAAGDTTRQLLDQTKQAIPGVVNYTVFVGQGVPESGNNALIFRTGYPEAIQVLYKNSTLESKLVKRFTIEEQKLDRTLFLEYKDGKVINHEEIRNALLKRNELSKNQETFQLWDFSKPLAPIGTGGSGTWFENSGTGRAEQRNGALVISAPGVAELQSPDFLPGGLPATRLSVIEITMRVPDKGRAFRGEFTWLNGGTPNNSASTSEGFDIVADGQLRTYRIKPNVTAFSYDDLVVRVRLQLPAGMDQVEIVKIEQKQLPPIN